MNLVYVIGADKTSNLKTDYLCLGQPFFRPKMDVFECGHYKYDVKTQEGKKTEVLKIKRHPREQSMTQRNLEKKDIEQVFFAKMTLRKYK